jgi:L-ascorbate 6-phosphate lactonase
MKDFSIKVLTTDVPCGSVGVFFLGQAGFILKKADGGLIAIDPYLSNCCERYFGFKRLMPKILDPGDLTFDQLLLSHAHYDHFDPDSIPVLMSNGKTELIGATDTEKECKRLHLENNVTYLSCGQTEKRNGMRVTGVPCDHGTLAPNALGLLVEIENKRIYYMGDTAYRTDLLENPILQNVDLLILPINGAFGNLNEEQAAHVVKTLNPKLAVPCHFWNFAEHGGNPGLFQKAMAEIAPENKYILMYQGEGIIL